MKKLFTAIAIVMSSLYLYGSTAVNFAGVISDVIVDSNTVKLTIYKYNKHQRICADGTHIDPNHSGRHRIVAISQDLMRKYPLGTKVWIVCKDSTLSGLYTVSDRMAKRWTSKIDILVDKNHKLCCYDNVKLFKLKL